MHTTMFIAMLAFITDTQWPWSFTVVNVEGFVYGGHLKKAFKDPLTARKKHVTRANTMGELSSPKV